MLTIIGVLKNTLKHGENGRITFFVSDPGDSEAANKTDDSDGGLKNVIKGLINGALELYIKLNKNTLPKKKIHF